MTDEKKPTAEALALGATIYRVRPWKGSMVDDHVHLLTPTPKAIKIEWAQVIRSTPQRVYIDGPFPGADLHGHERFIPKTAQKPAESEVEALDEAYARFMARLGEALAIEREIHEYIGKLNEAISQINTMRMERTKG